MGNKKNTPKPFPIYSVFLGLGNGKYKCGKCKKEVVPQKKGRRNFCPKCGHELICEVKF